MTTNDRTSPAGAAAADVNDGGQFVGRMFSGFGHSSAVRPTHAARPVDEPYRPLVQSMARSGETYRLQSRRAELRVLPDSPATDVMTDLSRVVAVTIAAGATIEEAHGAMVEQRVRSLFVVDEGAVIQGIVTANDIVGEKPIQVAQRRGARHADVLVSEVMTPSSHLEAMELQDVLRVRVGDIIETLKHSGRQHALVIESVSVDAPTTVRTVRGIFSLTQIARQLGLPPQVGGDVARTFAEIEAAVGS